MIISREEVEKVATLARLNLSDEEKDTFAYQLSDVLGHIEKLNRLHTDTIEPFSRGEVERDRLREDNTQDVFFEGDLMKNAPSRDKGHFKVPKVID